MTLVNKLKRAHAKGRLLIEIREGLEPTVRGLRWLAGDPAAARIKLHCPEYAEPPDDPTERDVVARIFEAFKRMKAAQASVDARYLPSSLWQQHLDEAFAPMGEALRTDDPAKFHFFLVNFGTWKTYTGIEYSTFIRKNMVSPLTRAYLRNDVFDRQLRIWRWFYNDRKPLEALTYPRHGNQPGAFVDGTFVGVNSAFKEVYGAILAGIITDKQRPVVGELGAGHGKLAYFTLRDRPAFAFVDFDLPETLCVAAYFLMKTWPERRALLYGEAPYGPDCHDRYDLVFMPSFEMAKLGESSIDLFLNHTSLGEMTRAAVANYVHLIGRATQYFFHLNHDNYPNLYTQGERGLLGYEYPLPPDQFRLLFRYPDIGHMLLTGGLDFRMDTFVYLYERIRQASTR